MTADADAYTCGFPGSDQPGETTVMREGAEGVSLCAAHLDLMVKNPDEFGRIWGPPESPPPEFGATS